jgi:hypothetical protein
MKKAKRHTGSNTNASDAVDDIPLPAKPTTDQLVDAGVKETFPASDPVSAGRPSETEYERQKRGAARSAPSQPPKRSPDWMFEKK